MNFLQNFKLTLISIFFSSIFYMKGYFIIFFTLFLLFLLQILLLSLFNYNIIILLFLLFLLLNKNYFNYQIYFINLFFIFLSFLIDFKNYYQFKKNILLFELCFYFTLLSKVILIYNILYDSKLGKRIRKYLHRRFRIFIIPCSRPRKIRREVISRILAIGYLQLISTITFLILTFTSIGAIWFSSLMTNPSRGYVPLAVFYPIKVLTSFLVLYGISTDTDIILALSYFGCLSCWNFKYVKTYISKKTIEYGGVPIPYGLNPHRVYVICFIKVIDVLWGLTGWFTIGTTFGKHFFSMNTNLVAVLFTTVLCLILSDVWISILFGVVIELLQYQKKLLKRKSNYDEGYDSELEELGLLDSIDIENLEEIKQMKEVRDVKEMKESKQNKREKSTKKDVLSSNQNTTTTSSLNINNSNGRIKKPKPFDNNTEKYKSLYLDDISPSQFSTTRYSTRL